MEVEINGVKQKSGVHIKKCRYGQKLNLLRCCLIGCNVANIANRNEAELLNLESIKTTSNSVILNFFILTFALFYFS